MSNPFAVVNYEIEMFLGTQILQKANVQFSPPLEILEGYWRNALTDSRIVHIRVLTEVFLSRGEKDEIKIDHLLPEWRNENIVVFNELERAYEEPLAAGESPKVYIDKLLAHATSKRGDRFNWSPVVVRMNPPLMRVLKTLSMDQFPGLMFLKYV
jgi:hypothetical protein